MKLEDILSNFPQNERMNVSDKQIQASETSSLGKFSIEPLKNKVTGTIDLTLLDSTPPLRALEPTPKGSKRQRGS